MGDQRRAILTAKPLPPRLASAFPPDAALDRFSADVVGGKSGYNVLISHDQIGGAGEPDYRWHISVTHPRFIPPWEDLVAIVHRLRPDSVFVVGIPPREWWINVHEHCLHATELKDPNLIEQWKFEGRGDVPTGAIA